MLSRLFGVNGKTRKQFYREWATISQGRDQKTLRQFAVTRWTLANATAGRLIHGSGLLEGVLRHYVDGYAILCDAMHNLEVPEAFCTEHAWLKLRYVATERLVAKHDARPECTSTCQSVLCEIGDRSVRNACCVSCRHDWFPFFVVVKMDRAWNRTSLPPVVEEE